MTNEELLKEIVSLPDNDKNRLERFIVFLKGKHSAANPVQKRSFREEKAFGMWKDREEMEDSIKWVRDIRKKHWRQEAP
ncbi:MAG: hypothetical protein KF855_00380 [Acidobacteria bacterium]|nr:hypothetical protein [Acidobacteriota bacterium]